MVPEIQTDEQSKTVAVIDIGSNSVRMVIAQVFADGRTEVLEQVRKPVRLGHDTFVTGRLSLKTVRAALTILRDYRQLMDTYKVDRIRAAATTAVREASNRDSFLDRVAHTVGFEVDVIEPTEQSRLIVSAFQATSGHLLGLRRRTAMLAEVGGGSTLLTIVRGGEIPASQSFNLGSIRMQEMLSTAGELPERAAELLRQHIVGTINLARKSLRMRAVRDFVAIGGDARFAAQQAGEPLDGSDLYTVEGGRLDRLVDDCVPRRVEDLAREYHMAFADAETLVPALLVYQALLAATRADRMIVSPVTMRDGLLIDLPRYISGEPDPSLVHSIILSAKNIGVKYQYDAQHAEHVAAMALRLYDALQKEHNLTPRHRLLLEVSALLHEVGKFVSGRAHHKHSYYLISNAEILGLKRDDIAVVARVARYHRKSMPKLAHPEYANLPHDQRMIINKLASILRVADALDRGHWQQLRHFEVEVQDQELVIYVKGAGDLTLERRAISAKSDLFEEIFGLKVRLEEGAPPAPRINGHDVPA